MSDGPRYRKCSYAIGKGSMAFFFGDVAGIRKGH
jgi:hypothetical protein